MSLDQLDKGSRDLLLHLYRETGADPAVQVSLYETGAALGLDRDAASRATEDLIGWELVELRTLSGGIGISEKAIGEIEASGLAGDSTSDCVAAFGKTVHIDDDARRVVEQITAAVKTRAGSIGLDFDRLSEVLADLKTIDAQLDSPLPKTTIVRECFRSLKSALETVETDETVMQINRLLKE